MTHKVLVLLDAAVDQKTTERGLSILRDFRIGFRLRIAAASLAPDFIKDELHAFQKDGGQLVLCWAADFLAPLVASWVTLPVLSVASEVQSLATFSTFEQAARFALQVLGLQDPELSKNIARYQQSQAAQMIALDQKQRVNFDG